ncbi:MAG: hypothetical protein RLZZ381_1488 [Cyanobacteriota bacterium]|jgi:hypothetical protein
MLQIKQLNLTQYITYNAQKEIRGSGGRNNNNLKTPTSLWDGYADGQYDIYKNVNNNVTFTESDGERGRRSVGAISSKTGESVQPPSIYDGDDN